MSLDELMDKMEDVRIKIKDRDKVKLWLFEYGCYIAEHYGLNPKTHPGFIEYCGVHKLARVYRDGMWAHEDQSWSGMIFELPFNKKGFPKKIEKIVRKEYKNNLMPTRQEYRTMIEKKSGPIKGLDFLEKKDT